MENKKKGKKMFVLFLIVVAAIALSIYINFHGEKDNVGESTIGSIAYDYDGSLGYTVYIVESGEYVPYLVLTNQYENSNTTLLFRKNIIGSGEIDTTRTNCWEEVAYVETLPMDEDKYEDSVVDLYLNQDFYDRFDVGVRAIIVDSHIEVSPSSCVDENDNPIGNYYLDRKVFLLSSSEIGWFVYFNWIQGKVDSGYASSCDGAPLSYFKEVSDKWATLEDGKTKIIWWNRTPGWSNFCATSFNGGVITESSTANTYGVRPAFAIPSDTKIVKEYIEEADSEVYLLDY